jgi:hypothetical protein
MKQVPYISPVFFKFKKTVVICQKSFKPISDKVICSHFYMRYTYRSQPEPYRVSDTVSALSNMMQRRREIFRLERVSVPQNLLFRYILPTRNQGLNVLKRQKK